MSNHHNERYVRAEHGEKDVNALSMLDDQEAEQQQQPKTNLSHSFGLEKYFGEDDANSEQWSRAGEAGNCGGSRESRRNNSKPATHHLKEQHQRQDQEQQEKTVDSHSQLHQQPASKSKKKEMKRQQKRQKKTKGVFNQDERKSELFPPLAKAEEHDQHSPEAQEDEVVSATAFAALVGAEKSDSETSEKPTTLQNEFGPPEEEEEEEEKEEQESQRAGNHVTFEQENTRQATDEAHAHEEDDDNYYAAETLYDDKLHGQSDENEDASGESEELREQTSDHGAQAEAQEMTSNIGTSDDSCPPEPPAPPLPPADKFDTANVISDTNDAEGAEGINDMQADDSEVTKQNEEEDEIQESDDPETWEGNAAVAVVEENAGESHQESTEILQDLDALTGQPSEKDILHYAIPMCAPYSAVQSNKYKAKITPGALKKGKAAKQALNFFVRNFKPTEVERELMQSCSDTQLANSMIGNSRVTSSGAQKVQKDLKKEKVKEKKKTQKKKEAEEDH